MDARNTAGEKTIKSTRNRNPNQNSSLISIFRIIPQRWRAERMFEHTRWGCKAGVKLAEWTILGGKKKGQIRSDPYNIGRFILEWSDNYGIFTSNGLIK